MALDFTNNSTDRVEHGSAATVDNLDPITYLIWCYPTTLTTSIMLDKRNTSGNGYRMLYSGTGTELIFVMERGSGASNLQLEVASYIDVDTWQFFGIRADTGGGDTDQKMFKGTLTTAVAEAGSYTTQTAGSGGVGDNSDDNQFVGNRRNLDFNFEGYIAWAGIWNIALTAGQIREQQFRPHPTSGCVLFTHYGFNGTGTQVDYSGSGNAGTVTGATQIAHVPLAPPFGLDLWVPAPPSGGTLIQLSATIAWTSATPDAVTLAVQRQLASTSTWTSATPAGVLGIQRQLATVAAWATTTNDAAELGVAKILAAIIAGQTTTPDTVTAVILRQFVAAATWNATTPDVAIVAVLRQLVATSAWQTATPSTTLAVSRQLVSVSAWTTTTPDTVTVAILRQLIATSAWQTATPDNAVLTIIGIIELSAALDWQSATPAGVLGIQRQLVITNAWQTATPAGILGIQRQLATTSTWQTATPDTVTLIKIIQLLAASGWQTATPDAVTVPILRPLAVTSAWQSATPAGVLGIQRQLVAIMLWQGSTPDNATLTVSVIGLVVGLMNVTYTGK